MVLTPSPLLDVPEVAAKLRLTEEHTRRLLRAGELPGLKIGKVWRVDAESLALWIEERQREKCDN